MVFIIVGLNLSCFRASLGDNDTIHHIQFDNPEEESYCDRYFYETQVTVERNLYAALILESSGTNMTISVERHGESLSKSHNWFHDRDNGIIFLFLVSLFIQYLVIIIIDGRTGHLLETLNFQLFVAPIFSRNFSMKF